MLMQFYFYLSGEICTSWHAHGHIRCVVTSELSGGHGVAEVRVVVIGTSLVSAHLVPKLLGVEGESLTCEVDTVSMKCISKHNPSSDT